MSGELERLRTLAEVLSPLGEGVPEHGDAMFLAGCARAWVDADAPGYETDAQRIAELEDEVESLSAHGHGQNVRVGELQAENTRLKAQLTNAADLHLECWQQWAYEADGRLTDGGLSTLEGLREAIVAAGRIDEDGRMREQGHPQQKHKPHFVNWHGVYRGTDDNPREVGWCEDCDREVCDGEGDKHKAAP